ncbi:phosphoribosylamine---glycine ligase [Gammaproteobacteria bacterium]
MIDSEGRPKVLEYNCRCGDPETQPILMRLRSDLVDLCEAALEGKLDQIRADWDPRPALGVVLAAGGYPSSYPKGDVIHGLDLPPLPNTKIFHAGTAFRDGEIVTQGGRVLCVCASGDSILEAQSHAYGAIEKISWSGIHFRKDIGHRALKRSIV